MLKGCSFGKSRTSYVRVKRIIMLNVNSGKLKKMNLGRGRVLSFSVIKQVRCLTCSGKLALTTEGFEWPSVTILCSFIVPATTVR